MAIEAKDVLFREDLAAGFDEDAVLGDMETLAEVAGDWRGHIPYEAAQNYHEHSEISAQYSPHVEGCDYCQRLIDAVHPTDRLISDLQSIRSRVLADEPIETSNPITGSMWQRMPIAAALLMGVMGTWLFLAAPDQSAVTPDTDQVALAAFLSNPDQLQTLEASNDPLAKFRAARIYLATDNPELAYRRIGEGFELANVEKRLVQSVAAASELDDISQSTLTDLAKELSVLANKVSLDEREQLRLMQLRAHLGQHDAVIASLKMTLEEQGDSGTVIRALEEAKLVK